MSSLKKQPSKRTAIVLSGGGARGAYEAGVLSYLLESVYPRLPRGFEVDIVSGTSVGAIQAAFLAASAHMDPAARAKLLVDTWEHMTLDNMFRLPISDILSLPLRALGARLLTRPARRSEGDEVLGGLLDTAPLERLVATSIPWDSLATNFDSGRIGALCVSCTEIQTGLVTVFMDGTLADASPWEHDPSANAVRAPITQKHVRASAAIPFLFPAVRVGGTYYVDGGVRMNTPLSPPLRLGADSILVVGLKRAEDGRAPAIAGAEQAITQPAFVFGKLLDALMLDQLEYELQRLDLINAIIERGEQVCGADFLAKINSAVRAQRGADYRKVEVSVVRPSEDIGEIAADCHRRRGTASMGMAASLLIRALTRGVPAGEADLLSYLYFDRCFTTPLVELGRSDASKHDDELMELFAD